MLGKSKLRIACTGLVAARALIGFDAKAIAQDKTAHAWLVGYWEGHLSDPLRAKEALFEIRVKSVDADGSFAVEWDRYGAFEDFGTGKLSGEVVALSFRNGNVTTLHRDGEQMLKGATKLANGSATPDFTFVKRSGNAAAPVTSDGGCSFFSTGRLSVDTKNYWHLSEGDKTKSFDRLWQNGVLLGDGQFLCHNGHLAKLN